MKTKGAKNKPKHTLVSLADLNKVFKPDVKIPVTIACADTVNMVLNGQSPELVDPECEIEMVVS